MSKEPREKGRRYVGDRTWRTSVHMKKPFTTSVMVPAEDSLLPPPGAKVTDRADVQNCYGKFVVAGEIVHHRIELTPENIHNPAVTMAWSNLELVCRECHALRHPKGKHRRRFKVDAFGNLTARDSPPYSP